MKDYPIVIQKKIFPKVINFSLDQATLAKLQSLATCLKSFSLTQPRGCFGSIELVITSNTSPKLRLKQAFQVVL